MTEPVTSDQMLVDATVYLQGNMDVKALGAFITEKGVGKTRLSCMLKHQCLSMFTGQHGC